LSDATDTTLVWLRRDLRLADNPALQAACERSGNVLAVYVHAPDEEQPWAPGAASRWWLHHSLTALREALASRGGALCVRRGESLQELLAVARECGAQRVYWNRLYEPAVTSRDRRIGTALRESGIDCESFNAGLLFEPWEVRQANGDPYRVFTPFWRNCERQLDTLPAPLPAPRRVTAPERLPASLEIAALGLLPRVHWDAGLASSWTPGEAGAQARIQSFCRTGLHGYATGRNLPGVPGSSRLSPHLHFGEIGPRQCLAAVNAETGSHPAAREPAAVFVRELGWREFAHHLLHHFPDTANAPLDARFESFPWSQDAHALEAWRHGRTGYPLVDAGMRELWQTGWMHNRVRMIVASLLTKNLRQHWLDGARWFWDTLVDADLANNTLGWQWTAGCGADAAPYFRVFNPVLQTERFDPQRLYVRRWLPELAALPDKWVHRPFDAPAEVLAAAGVQLGVTYPLPLVELQASRTAALAGYARIRGER
jgi:deoxyribodipyrimidine photo-lyase